MPKVDEHNTIFNLSFFFVFLLDFNHFSSFYRLKLLSLQCSKRDDDLIHHFYKGLGQLKKTQTQNKH